MRRRLSPTFFGKFRFGNALPVFIAIMSGFVSACATSAPLRTDVKNVLADPGAYDNRRIELSGWVIEYEPARGDTYRTLRFTLGFDFDEKVPVFCSGYEADAIAKASILVGEAFETGGTLVVIGNLKAGEGDGTPAEVMLESVEFAEQHIEVTSGRKTRSGFDVGGFHITPSIGIGATFSP